MRLSTKVVHAGGYRVIETEVTQEALEMNTVYLMPEYEFASRQEACAGAKNLSSGIRVLEDQGIKVEYPYPGEWQLSTTAMKQTEMEEAT